MNEIHCQASERVVTLSFSRRLASFEVIKLLRQVEWVPNDAILETQLQHFTDEHGVHVVTWETTLWDQHNSAVREVRNRYL